MSWQKLFPRASGRKSIAHAACSARITTRSGVATLRIAIRRPEHGWFRGDAQVSVEYGHGEHVGMLRIMPGGPFQVSNHPHQAHNKEGGVLHVSNIPDLPKANTRQVECQMVVFKEWIQIVLPDDWLPGGKLQTSAPTDKSMRSDDREPLPSTREPALPRDVGVLPAATRPAPTQAAPPPMDAPQPSLPPPGPRTGGYRIAGELPVLTAARRQAQELKDAQEKMKRA